MKYWFCISVVLVGVASAQDKAAPPPSAASSTPNLVLTVYLVSGLAEAQASAQDEVRSDLSEALQQMRGVLAYKSYKLIEAVTLRGRNNSGRQ